MATGIGVIQVSDRRLSMTRGGGLDEWDPVTNKSVLILGTDGAACVSYAGLAYVRRKPTDQWIAETLANRVAMPGLRGGFATAFDGSLRPRVGLALRALRGAIADTFPRLPASDRRHGIQMQVVGLIATRRRRPLPRMRPFIEEYSYPSGKSQTVTVSRLDRHFDWRREQRLGGIGSGSDAGVRAFSAGLAAGVPSDLDGYERMMVESVRSVSGTDRSVGPHCMSIRIEANLSPLVRFMPDPGLATVGTIQSYSPWIVGPGMIVPRSVIEGGSPFAQISGYRVAFDRVPAFPPGNRFGMFGQAHKPR